jgi:hypothetical protein
VNASIAVGFLAFFIASLVVGLRLIALWAKTHEQPELLIGLGVLGIGPAGFGGLMAGMLLLPHHSGLGMAVLAMSHVAVGTGVIAKCRFNWIVYRRDSRWACIATLVVAAWFVRAFSYNAWHADFTQPSTPTIATAWQSLLQVSSLLWGACESLSCWTRMRKRQLLGLAEPVVTNRFLLWGVGAGVAGLGSAIGTIASAIAGQPSLAIPWVVALSSAAGMTAAIAMWLAFIPPSAYLRFISRATS